jgi:hypothetical protein
MLLELWLTALKSEVGIAIPTDNRSLLRQHLYRARAEANLPELDQLVMLLPENEGELWLVHKDADSPGTDNKGYPKLVQP